MTSDAALGQQPPRTASETVAFWLPIALGLLVLYVPTLKDLFSGPWRSDEEAHGPIVLAISIWLLYRKWPAMVAAATEHPCGSMYGWPVVVVGLLLYAVGRSQDILMFEIGSAIFMLSGLLLLIFGAAALRMQWFALFFMLFMLPLPGPLVDAVTMPMKMAVSYAAENLLFHLGYPIARSGVMLQIAQYKLLVADACAGLHTLFSLEALGLLYLNVVRHDSLARNITLAVLIVPISFTANVIRVAALALITYYFGDAARQGFMHGFAGMVLFVTALLLIMGADGAVQYFVNRAKAKQVTQEGAP